MKVFIAHRETQDPEGDEFDILGVFTTREGATGRITEEYASDIENGSDPADPTLWHQWVLDDGAIRYNIEEREVEE